MLDLCPLGVESLWFKAGGRSSRCLLGIFAHPDDESFGPGATLARYADEGVEVHVLTLTDGAAGDLLSSLPPDVTSLADLRNRELRCSAEILGATAIHTLAYRDSGMSGTPANQDPDCLLRADRDTVVRQLCGVIRALQPHVVITHDSTGVYFHPDHIRTWELATAAFRDAGDSTKFSDLAWQPYGPQSLYYTVVPKSRVANTVLLARLSLKDPRRWGRNGDVDLTRLGIPDEDIQVEIDVHSYLEKKTRATACHRSQGGDNRRPSLFSRIVQRRIGGVSKWDYFMQAYPTPAPRRGPRKRDLFI